MEESGIRVRLRRGRHSEVRLPGDPVTFVVSYNPSFLGLTGEQRPDIVLRIRRNGWRDPVIVFDGKYWVDTSDHVRSALRNVL